MKNADFMSLINGYQSPLSRKEAILQAIFLIEKELYESATVVIENYELKIGELRFFNLKDEYYNLYLVYLANKKA